MKMTPRMTTLHEENTREAAPLLHMEEEEEEEEDDDDDEDVSKKKKKKILTINSLAMIFDICEQRAKFTVDCQHSTTRICSIIC